jgi:hypothetical protein
MHTKKTKKVIHQTIHILNISEQEQKAYGAKFTKKNEKRPKNIVPNSLMSYILFLKMTRVFFSSETSKLILLLCECKTKNKVLPSLGKQI